VENDLLRFEQWANKYRTLAIKKAVVLELELIGISVHVSVIREIVRDQYPRLNPTDREVLWALKVPTVVKVGPGRYQPARRSSLASAEAELERAVILRAYDHNLDRLQIDIPLDKSDSDLERISERVSQHEHEKQKALSNPHKMYLNRITNLTELHLGHEQISDVSPLTSLTNLTVLEISGNQISDISPLASLTNLT
jgi:hypothetical protein